MLSRGRSYDSALTPPREKRDYPDQTEILSPVEGQALVVSVAKVKEFVPIRHDQYNTTITDLIGAVTEQVEEYIKRDLLRKNIRCYWRRVPAFATLPRGPYHEITKVSVKDTHGNETVLTDDQYKTDGLTFKRIHSVEVAGELTVEFISGYDVNQRPRRVIGAILQEISLQFKNRQDPDTPAMTSVNNLSLEARHLLASLMRRGL